MNCSFSQVFVTATGTDVGKTFIASLLLRANKDWSYWKPVQTGGSAVDQIALHEIAPLARVSSLDKFEYDLAASPDQAAIAEFALAPTVKELVRISEGQKNLVIEGAGGLMVPLNEDNETWLDFLHATRMPVILVATSGLGTLNHTLLSIEALQSRSIPILALVLNGPEHRGNQRSLARFHPRLPLIIVPQLGSDTALSELDRLGEVLWKQMGQWRNESQRSESWLRKDQDFVWHPYTQHKSAPSPIPIVAARGSYLYTDRDERLLDASASWWTCSIGHGHPRVAAAIRAQQSKLDHCGFGNATHQPGSELAARLIALAGPPFTKVFYSDNGSCAVEVALKMASQTWTNRGEPQKTKFLYFEGAYHGDTFGAMSVAESGGFHKAFAPYVFKGIEAPLVTSHPSRLSEGSRELDAGRERLKRIFEEHAHELAGAIIEPWVQGAAGMIFQDIDWLRYLAKLCTQHKVFLILDEVFTGLGRIGDSFAFKRAGITADILCLAKGLTGGNLPLAATLCTDEIFEAFLDDDRSKALLHGHTFTANPIACAAALTSLDLYRELDLVGRARSIETQFNLWIDAEKTALELISPRAIGAILAFELGAGDYFHSAAYRIPELGRKHGLLLRTLGSTVYFVPPLVISDEELGEGLDSLKRTLKEYRANH
ncbi:MAG: adenosylmethionine--8-amino-7-oxononanoate transaminase [Chitinophagaceae bacterium]|nr:adenosylmethionine--8-amino-7-oxononanoate transaminase [Oligoflexus sp.]